jgi:glycogen synthase
MNVAIISPEYPPLTNWGGVATFNYNLARLLVRLGHTVHVITCDGSGDKERVVKKNNLTIHYIRYKTDYKLINVLYYRLFFGSLRKLLHSTFPKVAETFDWNIFSLISFMKLNKRTPFNIIHSPTYRSPSLFISLIYRNISSTLYVQGPQDYFNEFEPGSSDNKIHTMVENWYIRHCATKVVVCSLNVQKKLVRSSPKLRDKIVYIPNFIDVDSMTDFSQPNVNNIVFFGRLDQRKGVDILLHAFVKLAKTQENLNLYMIGETRGGKILLKNRFVSFDTFWNSLNIHQNIRKRIYFYPRIDDKNTLLELLKTIKGIAVFPSRYEPFGFVIIEAMALGYLVIASKRGGGKEIITHGVNGLLISPTQNSLDLVLKMSTKLAKEDIVRITRNAQHTVRDRYDIHSQLILDAYRNV